MKPKDVPPPETIDTGQHYAWEHEDGRLEWATPAMMNRKYPELDMAYAYRMTNPKKYPHHETGKGWRIIEVPPPGSPKAILLGDTCPRLDNANGAGYLGGLKDKDGNTLYVMTPGCPLHDRKRKP